jgi:hypothetical protein
VGRWVIFVLHSTSTYSIFLWHALCFFPMRRVGLAAICESRRHHDFIPLAWLLVLVINAQLQLRSLHTNLLGLGHLHQGDAYLCPFASDTDIKNLRVSTYVCPFSSGRDALIWPHPG